MTYKDLTIVFEDNHLIVAVKPAGVLSQADGSDAPDMLTLLKEYIKEKYNKPGAVFLGLLHRLDRPVSGLMVFAKTSKCASRISEQIRERKVTKRYRAVVEGTFKETSGTLSHYALKDPKTNNTRIFDEGKAPKDAKPVKLSYEVVAIGEYKGKAVSLVEIDLHTGRSHQIRTQLQYTGHPLLGDARYGSGLYNGDIALESFVLGFDHPTSHEHMEFKLPVRDEIPWNLFK
ncbi:MAG: RluA family pseudouridine synthase [Clostridiales bacterium]|nr:RluA family pseudouridine synthase [Clostridiales bacterium]